VTDAIQESPGVVLVTVLYHSSSELPGFVRSARSAAGATPLELIAVNNSADDEDLVRRVAEDLQIRLIQAPENPGYGGGATLGVAATDLEGRSVLIANPDVEFLGDAIAELDRSLRSADPDVAAVGPRILDSDGTVYPSARRLPSIGTGVGHALLGGIAPENPWTHRYRAMDDYAHDRDAEWLSGACFMMRASWFERLGGFDPAFFMYFEDVDLGSRIRAMSGRSRYLATPTVRHSGGHSTKDRAHEMVRAHHRSAALYLSRRYPRWYHAPVRIALRTGLWVRSHLLTRPDDRPTARPSKEVPQ
jgi:N-acetylglucosaminyl-diphospho-decaprenol L-rhamnosyltransferase